MLKSKTAYVSYTLFVIILAVFIARGFFPKGVSEELEEGVASEVEDVKISYGAGNTKIMAQAYYSVTVMDDDNVENLKEFYSEISIIPNCCMPVEVDDGCVAVKSAKAVSCGRFFNIKEGDSLNKGGKCEAC